MKWSLVSQPLRDAVLGNADGVLRLISGAVILVLLIACANVANLLLTQMHRREREFSFRTALGAERGRLMRQLLVEGLVLSLIGGAAGLLFATSGTNALLRIAPNALPRMDGLHVDARMMLLATLTACGTAILFALFPALRMTRAAQDNAWTNWSGSRGTSAGGWRNARSIMPGLISVQVGLAAFVVIWAALLVRSYEMTSHAKLGFDSANTLAFDITLPETAYAEPPAATQFYRSLISGLKAEPGVLNAGGVLSLPLRSGTGSIDIELEGHPVAAGQSAPSPTVQVITPGYFETMGIALERGRLPLASDDEHAPIMAWVNRSAAAKLWPNEDALGKRFRFNGDTTDVWFTVAGVVADVRTVGVQRDATWEYYIPHAQMGRVIDVSDFYRAMSVVVKTRDEPASLAPRIRQIVRALDAGVAPAKLEPMTEVVARATARPRLMAMLLGTFAALALTLAMVGVYGVLSYAVSSRTREIGIRMAIGASGALVMRLVLRDGLRAVVFGLAAGCVLAAAASRFVRDQLYQVDALDPRAYLFGAGLLLLLAAAGALVPTRAAVRIRPSEALRAE
jgi:predicted permease